MPFQFVFVAMMTIVPIVNNRRSYLSRITHVTRERVANTYQPPATTYQPPATTYQPTTTSYLLRSPEAKRISPFYSFCGMLY